MKYFLIPLLLIGCAKGVQDPTWLPRTMTRLDSIDSVSKKEKIEYLGTLAGMSWGSMDHEQTEVFVRAQGMLLAIPGHAEYYAEKLNKDREVLDNYKNSNPGSSGPYLSTLVTDQMYAFKTLGSLPSVETVRVLGELLDDERGMHPPIPGKAYDGGEVPNSWLAAEALTRLPIVSKPTTLQWNRIYDNDLEAVTHAWKLWYQQVKAGNRTFRFEGDATEYNLNGPLTNPAVGGLNSRERSTSPAASLPPPHSQNKRMIVVLLLALLILFAAVWKVRRMRRI